MLAACATVFSNHHVSVQTVDQTSADREDEQVAVLALMTHEARESDLQAVVTELGTRPFTRGPVSVIRVEGK